MKRISLFFILLFCMSTAFASTFNSVVFFGDSLSDNGNLYHFFVSHHSPLVVPKSPPYYYGRFSDGPVWSELLADYLQKNYDISSENHAVGDAAIVLRGPLRGALPITLTMEIDKYLTESPTVDKSKILFVIWIGANDYLDDATTDPSTLANIVTKGIQSSIIQLIQSGARQFLILNMPDLARVPQAVQKHNAARLGLLSQYHNTLLPEVIKNLQELYPTTSYIQVDAYYFLDDLIDHPGKYNPGITDTTDSCWTGGYFMQSLENPVTKNMTLKSTVLNQAYQFAQDCERNPQSCTCAHPDQYVFWDSVHPTRVVHQLLAQIMETVLDNELKAYGVSHH
jgi:phospholipase/lecithinase/hemolysin